MSPIISCLLYTSCEFVDTFLKLTPDTTVVLNIDEDHMDYFKTMDNLICSFHKFCEMTTKQIIANGDDPEVAQALELSLIHIYKHHTAEWSGWYHRFCKHELLRHHPDPQKR